MNRIEISKIKMTNGSNILKYIFQIFTPFNFIFLLCFESTQANTEEHIAMSSPPIAAHIIMALYGLFVLVLIAVHCCLKKKEVVRNEKSRDAMETEDDRRTVEEKMNIMRKVAQEFKSAEGMYSLHYQK